MIPYIQKVTDKFKNIASSINAKLALFSLNKLGRIIKAQKDTFYKRTLFSPFYVIISCFVCLC